MNILIVSSTPWNTGNSFGNTFSNLFSDIPDLTIALVCCATGKNDPDYISRCYQIDISDVIKSLCRKNCYAGKEICIKSDLAVDEDISDGFLIRKAKLVRWQFFFWARDLIWKCGKWKSPNLDSFLDDFKPDLLYIPIYYQHFMLNVAQYVVDYCNVPVIGHISDDNYTMRQFSISPLFWIDRLVKRYKIRQLVKCCRFLHVISQFQKMEYEKVLKVECRIFRKALDFEGPKPIKMASESPLFVYTGNIGCGRWKTLVLIGHAINQSNLKYGTCARLEVYSRSPCSKHMLRKMNIPGAMEFKGGVSGQKALELQATAEVLVHVESFNLKERLKVHQSFSTKIIDYLHTGNCVFAVGPKDVASIDYLKSGDAAIIAFSQKEIEAKVDLILRRPEEVQKYAYRGWEYAKKNNDVRVCRPRFYTDLKYALSKPTSTN